MFTGVFPFSGKCRDRIKPVTENFRSLLDIYSSLDLNCKVKVVAHSSIKGKVTHIKVLFFF